MVLLLGLLAFAALSAPGLASERPAEVAEGDLPAVALRLSPAVVEVEYGAGPSRHELRVDNLGSQPLTVSTELSDFTVTEDGTTRFLGPEAVSAAAWATLDVDTFELAPGERRDVTLAIEVPDDAEPGERYLSVIFAVPGDPAGGGNISVTHQVAVKLYIAVPGERVEHIELGELSGPRLIDTGPAVFELPVHNRGNVHRRFEEDSQLLATHADTDVPFENFTVLGDSTRVVEASWSDPPLLCWCTIEVEVDDGKGNLLTATTQVFAFPLRLSLALFTLTGGLAMLAIARRRRKRATHEQELAEAMRGGAGPPAASPTVPPRVIAPPVAHPPSPTRPDLAPRAAPHVPMMHAPAPAIPSPPPNGEPQQLDTKLFTAHGTHHRPRRGRRGR